MPKNITTVRDWAFAGIIGNGAYAFFLLIAGLVVAGFIFLFHENLLYVIIIALCVLVCVLTGILAIVCWRMIVTRGADRQLSEQQLTAVNTLLEEAQNTLKEAQNLADNFNKLDITLFDLIAFLHDSNEDLDSEIKQVIRLIFKLAITNILKDVQSASLFRPDIDKVLTVWVNHELNEDSMKIKCYGGALPEGVTRRGVAGEAFKEGKIIVTRISEENGDWTATSRSYRFLNRETLKSGREVIYPIQYSSMICAPLTRDGYQVPLGVLCFNSNNPVAFDTQEAKDRVQVLGDRFIAILLMYERLKQIRQTGPSSGIPTSNP